MFDSAYHFNKVGFQNAHQKKYLVSVATYSFRTENQYYLVEVERYKYDIFIIKYFLKKHKSNKKRFNLLSHEFKCSKIVATCVNIMLSILRKHPIANLGFLGAHTIDLANRYEEKKSNTRRFKIYKYAIEELIDTDFFIHFMDEQNSTYLIVNKKISNPDELSLIATDMFIDIHPELAVS